MIKHLFSLVILILALTFTQKANAQCGTSLPEGQQHFEDQLKQYKISSRTNASTPVVISVSIHVVSLDNTDYLAQSRIIEAFDKLNKDYAAVNMSFQVCFKDVINDPNNYAFYNLNEASVVAKSFVPNTINLYMVGLIYVEGFGQACGYAYYPSSSRDIIFVSADCFDDGVTLTHEMGHFFNLKHTHETSTGVELVNRSNCSTAGDMMCDTQADPGLGNNNVDAGCAYTGGLADPVGTQYQPPVHNYMSYTRRTCANEFTPQQYLEIRSAYDYSKTHLSTLNVTYAQSKDSLCTGGAVTFSIAGGSNFVWPNGSIGSSYTKTFTATYSPVQTVDVTFNAGTCRTTKRFTVYVYPNDNIVEVKDVSLCAGSSTEVYVYASLPFLKYQLKYNGVNYGTAVVGNGGKLTLPTGNILNTTQFEVWAGPLSGACSYLLTHNASSYTYVVPDPTKTLVSTTTNICKNSGIASITIQASQYGVSYQLIANGVNVGTPLAGTGNNLQFYNVPIPYTTLFTFRASNSCQSVLLNASVTINVQVYANASAVVTPLNPVVCKNGSALINVQSENSITYQLQNNNTGANVGSPVAGTGGVISLPTGLITTAQQFRIFAYNPTGCNLHLNTKPTVTIENTLVQFSISPIGIETGQTVDFINSSNTTQHVWNYNQDGINQTATSNNVDDVLYNVPGTYQVKLVGTSSIGCKDSIQKNIQVGTPTNPGDGSICKGYDIGDGKYIVIEQEVDKYGNTYLCGYYQGWNYQGDSYGMFVAKVNNNGVVQWTKTAFGTTSLGTARSYATGLAVDANGNCYVAINYSARMTIDGTYIGSSIFTENMRVAVLKFSSATGNLVWNCALDRNSSNYFVALSDIAISKNNEIYFLCINHGVSGNFVYQNSTVAISGKEGRLIEIDTLGNYKSSQTITFVNGDYAGNSYYAGFIGYRNSSTWSNGTTHFVNPRISFDLDDNLILSGVSLIKGGATLRFGSTNYNVQGVSLFTVKYNKAGQWTTFTPVIQSLHAFNGSNGGTAARTNTSPAMATDQQGNRYYVASYTGSNYPSTFNVSLGSTTLTINKEASFLIKTDANNEILWYSKSPGGLVYKSVSVNRDNHPVVFGIADTLAQFSSANGSVTSIASNSSDMFWAEYDDQANLLWARSLKDPLGFEPHSMGLDGCGNILLIGSSTNIQLGPDLISAASPRLFMAQFAPNGDCNPIRCSAIEAFANKNTYCGSDSISVVYKGLYLLPTTGNVFILELSDATGSFVNPLTLASKISLTDGTIKAVLPNGLTPGSAYKVRVNSSNPAITGEASTAFQISVPSVSIPAFLVNQNPLCSHDTLRIEIPSSLNGYQYQLLKNDIPSTLSKPGDGSTLQFKIPAPANHTLISFKVTQGNTCPAYSPAIEIITNTPPAVVLSAQDTLYYCDSDQPAVLSCSTADAYLWSNGETSSSLSITEEGNYSVKATDANGCYRFSDTVFVKSVFPSITVNDSDTHLCYTDIITLSASSGDSYLWNTGEISKDIQINTGGDYSVTISNGNCTSTSDIIEISSSPDFTAAITTPDSTKRCEGGIVILNSGFATGNTWSTGESSQQIEVSTAGYVSLTVSDAYGCWAQTGVDIEIYPLPEAELSLTQNFLMSTPSGVSYNWYQDGQFITQTYVSYLQLTEPGNYQVEVIDWYGCSTLSEVYSVSSVTNVYNTLSETNEVYPNPFHEQTTLYSRNQKLILLEIYDVAGKKVWENHVSTQANEYALTPDLNLPAGMYILHIVSEKGDAYVKILKK